MTRKIELCGKALIACFVVAALWGIVAFPESVVAGKGGGKGGGTIGPCVFFDDVPVDNVQSDRGDASSPYCDDRSNNVGVSFTNDGHLNLNTNTSNKAGAGRSLFIDFGRDITVLDGNGRPVTFRSTDDLDTMGVANDVNMSVGAFQDNFDMWNMAVGETRDDVNLQMRLFLRFGKRNQDSVRIVLAPEPLANERQCPGSDSVLVTFRGDTNADGLVEWRIEPAWDDDGDGFYNEDPIDGADNDADGLTDEDPPVGLACVTQNEFAEQEVTVGFLPIQFGFTVTAVAP